jgi:hypothetical protein
MIDALHAVLIGGSFADLDFLDQQIDRVSERIEEQLHPFAPRLNSCATLRANVVLRVPVFGVRIRLVGDSPFR